MSYGERARFVVSALESVNDEILERLDKGHTTEEAARAIALLREHGIEVRPSWMPFTPWTTPGDVVEMLDFVAEHDLVGNVDPVQYTIRLLLPEGSLLLERPDMRPHIGGYAAERLSYRWTPIDPDSDRLQARLAALVEQSAAGSEPIPETFAKVRAAALQAAGRSPSPAGRPADRRLDRGGHGSPSRGSAERAHRGPVWPSRRGLAAPPGTVMHALRRPAGGPSYLVAVPQTLHLIPTPVTPRAQYRATSRKLKSAPPRASGSAYAYSAPPKRSPATAQSPSRTLPLRTTMGSRGQCRWASAAEEVSDTGARLRRAEHDHRDLALRSPLVNRVVGVGVDEARPQPLLLPRASPGARRPGGAGSGPGRWSPGSP